MSDLRSTLNYFSAKAAAEREAGRTAAEARQLERARELLVEGGFVEHEDGTWHPSDTA